MHRPDTACDDGACPDTQDTGDTESIYSEKTGVDAECEIETVEKGECSESGESETGVSEVVSGCETISVLSPYNLSEVDCVERDEESGMSAGGECEMEFSESVESGQSIQKERSVDVACQTDSVVCVESGGDVTDERKTSVESETQSVEKGETGVYVEKEWGTANDCDKNSTEVTSDKSTWTNVTAKPCCSVCSKVFKISRALNIHMTKMHSKTGTAKTNIQSSSKHPVASKKSTITKQTQIKCLLCDKAFSSKQALGLHIMRSHRYLDSDDDAEQQHGVDVEPKTEQSRPHNCKVRKFPCNDCEKVFGSIRTLKLHEN